MQFVSKDLNDNFYLEGDRIISLRDKIFREVISNLLIHREFANPFPAKLIIEKDRVFVENSNKSHGNGIIDPENFSPFPKNPTIAKFFKEIGLVDELGSGVRNTTKYNKIYSDAAPTFIEGDVFKTIIPLFQQVGCTGERLSNELVKKYIRRDMLMSSPLFNEWVEEERKEAAEKATIKAQLETTKKNILSLLSEKFDFVPKNIIESVITIDDIAVLDWLVKKIIKVETIENFDNLMEEAMRKK